MAFQVGIWGHYLIDGLQSLIDSGSFPKNLGLDLNRYNVEIFGDSGLHLNDRSRLHSKDQLLLGKDLAIIDIVSVDLCDPLLSPEQLALNLMRWGINLLAIVCELFAHRLIVAVISPSMHGKSSLINRRFVIYWIDSHFNKMTLTHNQILLLCFSLAYEPGTRKKL